MIFTVLSIILVINSINYFDGIDASASLSFLSSIFLIIIFLGDFSSQISKFIFLSSIPIIVFIFFNLSIFKLPKLFLGDSGSLLIGFYLAFILIVIYKNQLLHPLIIAWTINLFIYEFVCVNLTRLFSKKGLFIGGQDHIHYFINKR